MDAPKILVIADDVPRRRRIASALRVDGYRVEKATSIARISATLRQHPAGAVLVHLGDESPLRAVRELRLRTNVPIIVVAEGIESAEVVRLLDAGADDCFARPFDAPELLARVRAVLRRAGLHGVADGAVVTSADFTVHLDDRRWIRADGVELRLTPTEWQVVEVLARQPTRLVPHRDVIRHIWGRKGSRAGDLRVHLAAIRRKVEPDPSRPRYFITVPGVGLRFDPEGASAPDDGTAQAHDDEIGAVSRIR
jgi:two-component system KDP operon response regulator KdpE